MDLETALRSQPEVADARVLEHGLPNAGLDRALVILCLQESALYHEASSKSMKRLRKFLVARVGKHAVPRTWLLLDDIPCAEDGTLDEVKLIQHLETSSGATAPQETSPSGLLNGKPAGTRDSAYHSAASGSPSGSPTRSQDKVDDDDHLLDILSSVLNTSTRRLRLASSFLDQGGDSVTAVEFASLCAVQGIAITVPELLTDQPLNSIILQAVQGKDSSHIDNLRDSSTQSPASLHIADGDIKDLEDFGVQVDDIEACFPCTSLQQGLMGISSQDPQAYIARFSAHLKSSNDVQRLANAWNRVVATTDILRTRIGILNGELTQIVLKFGGHCEICDNVGEPLDAENTVGMSLGQPLAKATIISSSERRPRFVLTIHHAAIDGWSLRLLVQKLHVAYDQGRLEETTHFGSFARHLAESNVEDASKFWVAQLQGAGTCDYPRGSTSNSQQTDTWELSGVKLPKNFSVTTASLLRAAWALTLNLHSGSSNDVTFGATVSGRAASFPGIANIIGPVIATVPIRVRLDPAQKVSSLLREIQSQSNAMIPYEHTGLQNVSKLSDSARDACRFRTLFVVQPRRAIAFGLQGPLFEEAGDESEVDAFFSYPIVVQCKVAENSDIDIMISYDSNLVSAANIEILGRHFKHAAHQLCMHCDPDSALTLADVDLFNDHDAELLASWQNCDTVIQPTCLSSIVLQQAARTPQSPALLAHDACLTYFELNAAANRLAHYMRMELNVLPGNIVALCVIKSAWQLICMLAINKVGAAFCPLADDWPEARRQAILTQIDCQLVLASPGIAAQFRAQVDRVLEVSNDLQKVLCADPRVSTDEPESVAHPLETAYILFTSGSTGQPKGVVATNQSVCTAAYALTERYKITADTRMLQYSSYTFDMSTMEIFPTFWQGGCVCLPSEAERRDDIAGFIRASRVNFLMMTPSVLSLFSPAEVPGVNAVLVGGEMVPQQLIEKWLLPGTVRLISAWGPTESCMVSASHEYNGRTGASSTTIGKPVGGHCWIVDGQDYRRLAPVGCVGEIVVQSSTLAKGYFGDPEKTEAAFISTLPDWACQWVSKNIPPEHAEFYSRFYRTGDMAYWNSDGTLEIVGRVDAQRKLHGLRFDVGEIEHHLRKHVPESAQIAVELVDQSIGLVAFYCNSDRRRMIDDANDEESILLESTPELLNSFQRVAEALRKVLPPFMVPTRWAPLKFMPFTTAQKLNRKCLRTAMVRSRDPLQYSLVNETKTPPTTEMELVMQALWG